MHNARNLSISSSTTSSPRSPQLGFSTFNRENASHIRNASQAVNADHMSVKPRSSVVVDVTPPLRSQSPEPEALTTVRRIDRSSTNRVRRDSAKRQNSLRQTTSHADLTTVGEYALHHLLTNFIKEADERIERCLVVSADGECDIEAECGKGVDPGFDQLISALGHIGRDRPKSLIDSIMIWRRGKGEITAQHYNELQRVRSTSVSSSASNSVASGTKTSSTSPRFNNPASSTIDYQKVNDIEANIRRAEKRSAISVFILCRVLVEIIGQCKAGSLPDDTANRLEDVIWVQVRNTDADVLRQSQIKQAQWSMFGQLLGVMSSIRFDSVVDRYLNELATAQIRMSDKGHAETEVAKRTALLVTNMQWLAIDIVPDAAWTRSCDALCTLATQFTNVSGKIVKQAYCFLLQSLLLPIAAHATTQLTLPQWSQCLESIRYKLSKLLVKPKYWAHALPLSVITLCVSPLDDFKHQWLPMALALHAKTKDRSTRSHSLKAICRLLWRYIYRVNDPDASKKIEDVVKPLLQTGRKSIISTDPAVADPLIQLIRIIGHKHQDTCFRQIIFPLINAELILSSTDLRIDVLEPDRMVIAIRAFLAIMSDFETKEAPVFPVNFACDDVADSSSEAPFSPRLPPQRVTKRGSRIDRLSKPVLTTDFEDLTKEFFNTACSVLGKIAVLCDNALSSTLAKDDLFSASVARNVMSEAFTFARRDESASPADSRRGFHDLLHVAIQALPRCLTPHVPSGASINLLCTGTAHVHSQIASSSAQSLKSIARQNYAQQVTISFARFVFEFSTRSDSTSDTGLLGAQQVESTLRLYVELLEIWIEQLQSDSQKSATRDPVAMSDTMHDDLSKTRTFAHVDEIESHGLFFVCSPSKHVRAFALRILRLVNKFDDALGQPSTRIVSIFEGDSREILKACGSDLTVAERSRFATQRSEGSESALIELCHSDVPQDKSLWLKLFPKVIRLSQRTCPQAVLLTREIVCKRLLVSLRVIKQLAEQTCDQSHIKVVTRQLPGTIDTIIEQWMLHLIFSCTTITNTGSSNASHPGAHSRQNSKASIASSESINTAAELFETTVPLLSARNENIRRAVAVGLGSISPVLYCALHTALQPLVVECNVDAKLRLAIAQKTSGSPQLSRYNDALRTELTHLFRLTAHCLSEPEIMNDEKVIQNLATFTRETRIFLNDEHVQNQWAYQKTRTYYCGLIETAYEVTSCSEYAKSWMPFQSRKATFSMLEDWCGHAPNQAQTVHKDDRYRRTDLERAQDHEYRGVITATMEIERRDLRVAALGAMAALCAGPLVMVNDGQSSLQFDVKRMLRWIETTFTETPSDRSHATGRKALTNLIEHNRAQTSLISRAIEMCYLARSTKALSSYFEVVTKVLTDNVIDAVPFWKIICVGLYTLGHEKGEIRTVSVQLLRTFEERLGVTSRLKDLDISVSDRTTAVYKLAQYQISQRLAKQHADLAFHVFSEFSVYFKELVADQQRNMVSAMLPWMQTLELQVDTDGAPTATSHMLLVNLFEITVRSSNALHNEIQALWQALAAGPHGGNVQVILDFIIAVCLERREHNFVEYAKQVSVFLSGTSAGAKVVDFLLLQLTPKTMVIENVPPKPKPQDSSGLPYVADLSKALPNGNVQVGLSLGQVCLMLLVDLVVSPIDLPNDRVPSLLQTLITLWDHHNGLVQDQAHEMLVHMIHELVVSKIGGDSTIEDMSSVQDLVDTIRNRDPKTTWTYQDSQAGTASPDSLGVPDAMTRVINQTIDAFALIHRQQGVDLDIRMKWAKTSLEWATACPVRHIACRSFQVYRCILQKLECGSFDQEMLTDMLARLSNTIADEQNEYLTFSQEIFVTLRTVVGRLEPVHVIEYPQLLWVTAACLETTYEGEFIEGLAMLAKLLERLDLDDPAVIKLHIENKPQAWQGEFTGLQMLVFQGLRSSRCFDAAMHLIERLIKLPSNEIVGDDRRLLFTVLAKLPQWSLYFDEGNDAQLACAVAIAEVCDALGHGQTARVIERFAQKSYDVEASFCEDLTSALRKAFFPLHEFDSLVFLIGLLNNQLSWVKIKTMKILCCLLPELDMRKPIIASQGPDLISPVLRLLQTNHCQQALEVLDNVMLMTGTPLDHEHIRMSMAGSHSSRATRKEYENTHSLYGIPEESGWSVPMPALHAARTRHNVQAVVRTCARMDAGLEGTPKIEFTDEQAYGGYFSTKRSAPAKSPEGGSRPAGGMSELAMKLDSLDDFFDDPDQTVEEDEEVIPMYSANLNDDREDLYDQQTLPILHKSLNRSASVTSFRTGFADARHVLSRETSISRSTSVAPTSAAASSRGPWPVLHNRSSTSPAVHADVPLVRRHQYQKSYLSADETGDEPDNASSDDEAGRNMSADPGTSRFAAIAQDDQRRAGTAKGLYTGFRQGMRRLTNGTNERREEAVRGLGILPTSQKSPKVPRVPQTWLTDGSPKATQ